jgi:hypothetical protein
VLRNATSEQPCDNVGPAGTADGVVTIDLALGRHDPAGGGAVELAAAHAHARPLRVFATTRHPGELPATGALLHLDGDGVVATALKPASRGGGLVLHLERPGAAARTITLRRGALAWDTVSQPDLLERDDRPAGAPRPGGDGHTVRLDQAITALRLTSRAE